MKIEKYVENIVWVIVWCIFTIGFVIGIPVWLYFYIRYKDASLCKAYMQLTTEVFIDPWRR